MSRPSGFSRAEIDGKLRELPEEIGPSRLFDHGRYYVSVRLPGEQSRRRLESEQDIQHLLARIAKGAR
jgi:hypothetical protein